MSRRPRPLPSTALAVLMVLCISGVASASAAAARSGPDRPRSDIDVYPGPNAISKAIAAAHPGDILRIHAGTYPESPTVPSGKDDLTLEGAGDGTATVDGGCATGKTIQVQADGVTVRGLRVVGAKAGFGAEPAEIDFSDVASGLALDNVLVDTCNAQYGINVFASGTVTVSRNRASGFSDSGIYIGGITSGGDIRVTDNAVTGNFRGIIVEQSSGSRIQLDHNTIHDNSYGGIFLTHSSGILITDNRISNDVHSGIELDCCSDGNRVVRNRVRGHVYDLADYGTGNCWRNNAYTTSTGDIAC
jgi:parallel beta-helix repeat protein